MKRRDSQERDEEIARAQAEERRERLLTELRAREVAARQPVTPATPEAGQTDEEPTESADDAGAELDPGEPDPGEPDAGEPPRDPS